MRLDIFVLMVPIVAGGGILAAGSGDTATVASHTADVLPAVADSCGALRDRTTPPPDTADVRPSLASVEQLRAAYERSYTEELRRRGLTGQVRVRALVDPSGRVVATEIGASSGHAELDSAAVAAVRETEFNPAERDGEPICWWVGLPPLRY